MYHYRPVQVNSRLRLLIAVLTAIALHIGLLNTQLDRKPVQAPVVSLPRSVTVLLKQNSMAEAQVQQIEKTQTAEHVIGEQPIKQIKTQKSVTREINPVKEKKDTLSQQPATLEKSAEQPAVDETLPVLQKPEGIDESPHPALDKTAKVQKPFMQAEPEAAKQSDGETQPGALQMAYPRYQLNIPPPYPGLARKRGQQGTVILQVLVNKEGRVDDLEIKTSSGFRLLDRAALSAVSKWSFEPGKLGDERIEMWVNVPVSFKLK